MTDTELLNALQREADAFMKGADCGQTVQVGYFRFTFSPQGPDLRTRIREAIEQPVIDAVTAKLAG